MNTAGISQPSMRAMWPVFSATTHEPLDLTSDDTVSKLYVAEWLADAIPCVNEEDEERTTIRGIECVCAVLAEPAPPNQLFEWVTAYFSADHWYDHIESDNIPTTKSELLSLRAGKQT